MRLPWQVGDTRLLCSTKPSKTGGVGIRAALSAAQTAAIVPGSVPCGRRSHCSMQRSSSQAFSVARSGKSGISCSTRWRESCTLFSTCPFSHERPGGLSSDLRRRRGQQTAEGRGRVAELGLEDVVACHRQEPGVDLARLA